MRPYLLINTKSGLFCGALKAPRDGLVDTGLHQHGLRCILTLSEA
jgi:hypothetical protein